MDKRLYLDVNRFATRTVWAHGFMAFLARPSGLAIIALLFLGALVRARAAGLGGTDLDQVAALLWVALGTGLAYAVSIPVVHVVGRARPYVSMPQARVLISRPAGYGFPNEHAVIAGAVAAGLWLSRAWIMAGLATVASLLIAFAVVYTGTAYPGDAIAGLLLGALVCLVLYPFAIGSMRAAVHAVARSPLKIVVGGGRHGRPGGPGPAASPEPVGQSGGVRILAPDEVRTVRVLPRDVTSAGGVRILPPAEEPDAGAAQS